MIHLTAFCILVAGLSAVTAAPVFDKYIMYFNTSLSQTGVGLYFHPTYTDYTYCQYAEWIMDFQNNQLRFTIGTSDQGNHLQLMSLNDNGYVVERSDPTNSSTDLVCYDSNSWNFTTVMGAYLYPYMQYLSDAWLNNQVYRMYAGVSPDPVTGTNIPNLAFVNSENGAFVLNAMLSNDGYFYYAFSNVTLGVPPASYYKPSNICNYTEPVCDPPCGENARCVNNACECFNGYTGDANSVCTTPATTVNVGSMNITYDEYLLAIGGDAVSQTCIGTYGDPATGVTNYTQWVQDLENQRIRWDFGYPNASGSVTYYFLKDVGYTVTNVNGVLKCENANQMTFSQAFNNMFYPTTRYIVNASYNGVAHRVYAGMNPLTPGSASSGIVKYITGDKKFALMAVLTKTGYVYYDYTNVTLGAPDAQWFDVSSVCSAAGDAGTLKANGLIALALLAVSTLTLRWTQ